MSLNICNTYSVAAGQTVQTSHFQTSKIEDDQNRGGRRQQNTSTMMMGLPAAGSRRQPHHTYSCSIPASHHDVSSNPSSSSHNLIQCHILLAANHSSLLRHALPIIFNLPLHICCLCLHRVQGCVRLHNRKQPRHRQCSRRESPRMAAARRNRAS